MSRLIVFGNRDFPDRNLVWDELAAYVGGGSYRTIVHGACPTGADKYASDWVKAYRPPREGMTPLVEEPHPADFETHGRAAGPMRNAHVVSLGATFALGFWDGLMRGTIGRGSRDIVIRLIAAEIPMLVTPPKCRRRVLVGFSPELDADARLAAVEVRLRAGCAVYACVCGSGSWLEEARKIRPRSAAIASRLNATGAPACEHHREPCYERCGVGRLSDGTWIAIPEDERQRWFDRALGRVAP